MDVRYPVTQYIYRPVSVPMAGLLSRTGITPIQVTLASAGLAFAAAGAFAAGAYRIGSLLALCSVISDCADGDLARLTGNTSRRGAFLDSVLDRWTDSALIIGLGLSVPGRYSGVAAFALVGALLTSYTRARAQSLGIDVPEGVGGRDVRLFALVIATALGYIFWGLVAVGILGTVTSLHRTVTALRSLNRLDDDDRRQRTP